MNARTFTFGFLAAALLGACGGGGGDGPDTTPPTLAGTPSDAGAFDDASVTFSWAGVAATDPSGISRWRVQVGTAPADGAVISTADAAPTATSAVYDAAALGEGAVLHARVAAVDGAGNSSAWSAWTDGVTIDLAAPSVPGVPAAPAFAAAVPVRFTWETATDAVSGVASYDVEIATATDGTGVVFSGPVGNVTSHEVTAAEGTALHARARAVDALGHASAWSAWSAGTVVDLSPPAVSSVSPADRATDVPRASTVVVTFSEPVDPATVTDSSVTLVDALGAPVAHARSLDGPVLTLTPSGPLANFRGHTLTLTSAVADLAGRPLASASSSSFRTTDEVAPSVPGVPRAARPFARDAVSWFWGPATDVDQDVVLYELQLASAASEGAVLETFTSTGLPSTSLVVDLSSYAEGASFFARVRAFDTSLNPGGWSAFGEPVTKDTVAPGVPGTPAAASPIALASPVRFTWDPASDGGAGVDGYLVELGDAPDGGTVVAAGFRAAAGVDVPGADGARVFVRAATRDLAGNVGAFSPWSAGVTIDLLPPSAPGAPTDAGAYTTSPAAFSWAAASDTATGVASYFLRVTKEDGAEVFAANVGNVTSRAVAAADGDLLVARVHAIDGAGRAGAESGPSDGIRVDLAGPTAPGAPDAGGPYTDALVAFGWAPSTDAGSGVARYVLELSQDELFAVPEVVDAGTAPPLTFDASLYADGQPLFARVHAIDALGNEGPSSEPGAVILDRSGPTAPGAPVDGGAASFERTLHFAWAPADDATSGVASYTVELATSAGGPAVRSVAGVVGTSVDYEWTGTVPPKIFARVRAVDVVGNEGPASGDSDGIEIRADAPGTPRALVDAGRYSASTTTTFSWVAPAVGAAPDAYVVEVGTAPGLSDVVAGAEVTAPSTEFALDASLRPNGETYYARVAARAGAVQGAWSASTDGLTVDATPPSAPGAPLDRGDVDDRLVGFDWSPEPAADLESGVVTYEVEVLSNGASLVVATGVVGESYVFDAGGREGERLTARVRAVNGAGTAGPFGPLSDGVVVDTTPPTLVAATPAQGATGVPTNADVVLQFSEPMDQGLTEGAFAIDLAGTSARNGVRVAWNDDGTGVVLVPDVADPIGVTNVDVFPALAPVRVTIAETASDMAGNPLAAPVTVTFTTADETPPRLAGLSVAGDPSPVAPALVRGPFTLVLAFDEDMQPGRGAVALTRGTRRVEARYQAAPLVSATTGAGTVTYVAAGCPDVRVGDRVTIRNAAPPSFDVANAAVTAAAPCAFTVAHATTDAFAGGGEVAYPWGVGARPAWTGSRTLEVSLEAPFPIDASEEAEVEGSDLADASGNEVTVETGLQVSASDAQPPALFASLPRDLETGVPGMRPVVLRFTEPLDRTTLAGVRAVAGGDDALYHVEYSERGLGPSLVLAPLASPPPGTFVSVQVPGTVRDLAGNPLPPVALGFTVGASGDLAAPSLAETLPERDRATDLVSRIEVLVADATTGLPEALDARSVGPEDVLVSDATTGLPLRGWRVAAEPGSGVIRLLAPRNGALASGGGTRRYSVDVGVPEFLGGTGILDAHGNRMDAGTFSLLVTAAENRVPRVESFLSLRLGTASSPAGRSLSAQLAVVDPDGGPVDVSVTADAGGVLFPEMARTVVLTSSPRYEYPPGGTGGGAPATSDPPALGAASFATSGLHSVEITLDDGTDRTTYVRETWFWGDADLPGGLEIDDGGTGRRASPSRPMVVENTSLPTVFWTPGAWAAAPDFLAATVAPFGAGAPPVVLSPDVPGLRVPVALEVGPYAVAVAAQRFAPGSFEPSAAAWSLDPRSPWAATLVYGPGNRAYDAGIFGVAKASVERDPATGALARLWDANGWWEFELAPAGEVPVFHGYNLLDNFGDQLTSPPLPSDLFAAGLDGSFVATETLADGIVAAHGFAGRGGSFFAVAQDHPLFPAITAGSFRYAIGGLGPSLPAPMAYVHLDAQSLAPGLLDGVVGSVGVLTETRAPEPLAPGELTGAGRANDGSPIGFTVPYSVEQDGLVQIGVGGAADPATKVSGFWGGAPGAEIVALASDTTPDRLIWFLLARAGVWTGAETVATLHGEYRLVDLAVSRTPAGALGRAEAVAGRVVFDGAGGYAWEAPTGVGTGTYEVDAVARRVRVTAGSPGGPTTFELVVGPDFGTLLGVGTSDPAEAHVVVLNATP